MGFRTTPKNVMGVLDRDYDKANKPDLTPYIAAANVVVNRVAICAVQNKGITLGADELEMTERWLAAHMYCASDKPFASKSTQGASGSYQAQKGSTGLETTEYGKRALLIDYSGCLEAIDKRKFAYTDWVGTPPDQQPTADSDVA